MKIRRLATAAATMLVAFVVALAVPVSQLRTVSTVFEKCCCPDPAHCKCPDHTPDGAKEPQLKSCHRTSHDVLSPQLPAFSQPVVALVAPPVRIVTIRPLPPGAPHRAPAPPRPDAPS